MTTPTASHRARRAIEHPELYTRRNQPRLHPRVTPRELQLLYTAEQAMEHLRVSRAQLSKYTRTGRLNTIRREVPTSCGFTTRCFFLPAEVEALAALRNRNTTTPTQP